MFCLRCVELSVSMLIMTLSHERKALATPAQALPSRMTPPDGVLDGRAARVVARWEKVRERR